MQLDTDNSGLINANELRMAFAKMGLYSADADAVLKAADFVNNEFINYTEFLAATIHIQNELTEERLWNLFKTFDVDSSGSITRENLQVAF
jgi:calcium-dependent protein kinase